MDGIVARQRQHALLLRAVSDIWRPVGALPVALQNKILAADYFSNQTSLMCTAHARDNHAQKLLTEKRTTSKSYF
jgi:hypothetical protein